MKNTSSVVTGSVTFAAAGVAPLIEWCANSLLKLAMPPQVVLIVAAGLVTAGHFLVNLINARAGVAHVPVTANKEAGFARVSALLCVAAMALAGCSLMSPTVDKIEAGAMQTVVQSAERTICRDLPIGAWMSNYGTNADRVKGWQAICFNPIKAPLNDATVAAILKVYPGFQQAVDAGSAVPALIVPPVAQTAPPAAEIVAPPAPAPAVVKAAPPRRARAKKVAPVPAALPPAATTLTPAPVPVPTPAVMPAQPAVTTLLSAPVTK